MDEIQKCLKNCHLQGLYVGGTLGDRYNPVKVLALGMWTSSITVCFMNMSSFLWFIVYVIDSWSNLIKRKGA